MTSGSESKEDSISQVGQALFSWLKLKYLLFIFPSIYFILLFIYYHQSGPFFTTFPDSTYIYLINGANIASGNMDIGHFDNPGTPAHWLAGIVIFIAHLFIDRNPVYESVITNPELYLKVCAVATILLLLLSVYESGKLVLKNTGNIVLALFFQLIPISSYSVICQLDRIGPESLIIICLTYYSAFLWVLCYQRNTYSSDSFGSKRLILIFSFFTALLITTKIICLPFLITPLFFIKRVVPKIWYLLLTAGFSGLILYPVWSKFPDMFNWFMALATHSGAYGSGSKETINIDSVISNLKLYFSAEFFFTAGYILISIGVIAGAILKRWSNHFYKHTLVSFITISLQVILVSKQFAFHYVISSQLLIIPGVISAFMSLVNFSRHAKLAAYSVFSVCAAWLIVQTTQAATVYRGGNKMYESSLTAKKYKDLPKIITTGYQASCFVESALYFGAAYGGGSFHTCNDFLRKHYPDAYVYSTLFNYLRWWNASVYPSELFKRYPQILIYFSGSDEAFERKMIRKITIGYDSIIKNVRILDFNPITRERFYLLNVDTAKANLMTVGRININCDLEKKLQDNTAFTSSMEDIIFYGTGQSSTEQHFSGNTSVKCSVKDQYACCTTFDVRPGDAFDISVNNYSNGRPGGIALVAADQRVFALNSESVVEDYENGWKRINLKTVIPQNYPEHEVRFCLYYYGNGSCYFDDLKIVLSKK